MQIDANAVIARYQQELANANHRAILAEAGQAALQARITELEQEATTAVQDQESVE